MGLQGNEGKGKDVVGLASSVANTPLINIFSFSC